MDTLMKILYNSFGIHYHGMYMKLAERKKHYEDECKKKFKQIVSCADHYYLLFNRCRCIDDIAQLANRDPAGCEVDIYGRAVYRCKCR